MAALATGFTKFFAPSMAGRNKTAQSARAPEGDAVRKCRIIHDYRVPLTRPPRGRFRMTQLELLFLQRCAGGRNAAELALLALPDSAAWQVPRQSRGAAGKRADAAA